MLAASNHELEAAAQDWLAKAVSGKTNRGEVADLLLQAWWRIVEDKPFDASLPDEAARQAGWRAATAGKTVEIGWLARQSPRAARFEPLTLAQIGL